MSIPMQLLSGLRKFLVLCLLAYLFICVFMWAAQRHLLYGPSTAINPPQSYGLQGYEDVRLQASDGTHIHAWHSRARGGYPTIVYFHGNGGNLSYDAPFFQALTQTGFGLLAIDYRGYGASEGTPSEEGLYQDARTSVEYAMHELGIPAGRIILYGESLGTGVAVKMATEYPVAALVLQSPYSSVEAVAKERYSWLPVHLLIRDRFDSIGSISHTHAPLLLLHGEWDGVVPVQEGKKLFASAPEPKTAVYFPRKGHNDLDINARVTVLMNFSQTYKLIKE